MRNRHTVFFILLALLVITAFYDVVFLNKTFKVTTANSQAVPTGVYGQEHNKPRFIPVQGTDSPVLEEPVYEFIKRNLRRGTIPLWNPHQACGYPLIGMVQVGIFYPLNLILYLLPETFAWDILILLRIFLAGFLTFRFMRLVGFRPAPSLTAAIAFMFSGPMLLFQFWTVNVDILTPLLLIGCERLLRRTSPRERGWLGLAVALTIFGGHPEHIFLVNLYAFLYFVFRLFTLNIRGRRLKAFGYYVGSVLLGAGLSAIVLFPFIYNLLFEFWHGHPHGVGTALEENPVRALSLILPHFFQKAPITFQWMFAGWWGGYIGLLPFALAFMGLFHRHKKGMNIFFGTMAFLIIAKEYSLPVINWIGVLPVFRIIRYAIHTPPLAAFSVAVLAGMGTRAVLSEKNSLPRALGFITGVIFLVASQLWVNRNSPHFDLAYRATLFAALISSLYLILLWAKNRSMLSRKTTAVLLTALLFAELFLYIHRERPRRFASFAPVPYIEHLKSATERIRSYGIFWAFYPNTATGFGVDDLGYFFGMVPKRFVTFVNTLLIKDHFRNDLRPPALRAIPIQGKGPLLDLLNVRFLIAPPEDELSKMLTQQAPRTNIVYSREVTVFQRPNAFPRTYVVHKARFEPDDKRSLAQINDAGRTLRYEAVINHPPVPEIEKQLQSGPLLGGGIAEITHYSPNRVDIHARLDHPGFLVLSDAYHPDWKASVDGRPAEIFRTDYLLRSVFLPAGDHEVRFRFMPASFFWGAGVSALSLAGLLFLFYFTRRKNHASTNFSHTKT